MKNIIVIAALEREVQALIVDGRRRSTILPGTSLRCYQSSGARILCGGIGPQAARAAALAAVNVEKPDVLISVGFAGALDPDLRPGEIVEPATVIDASTGKSYATHRGAGVLISADRIADAAYKAELYARYNGKAVDMEAAAVADVALQRGIEFSALKAISDEADVTLPDLTAFIDPQGNLALGRFLRHIAVRPSLWRGISKLARNSARASKTLQQHLSAHLASGEFQRLATENESIEPK